MKRWATPFGALLLVAGVLGFIPALCPDGKLLGLFAVDAMHNLFHVATGVLGIAMGIAGDGPARNYFRGVGIVYVALTALGLAAGRDGQLLGMAHNSADIALHAAIALVTLALGFSAARDIPPSRGSDLRGI